MAGIKYYPSRDQKKAQRVVSTDANIALTSSEVGSLFYCYNGSALYISLSATEDAKIPVGSQFDFIRVNEDVRFSAASGSISYYSSVGSTPKIRILNSACTFLKIAPLEWAIIGDIVAP